MAGRSCEPATEAIRVLVVDDLHLPRGATLGAIEEIMAGQPTPIVLHTTAAGSASGLMGPVRQPEPIMVQGMSYV
jgi:hypothetical protein